MNLYYLIKQLQQIESDIDILRKQRQKVFKELEKEAVLLAEKMQKPAITEENKTTPRHIGTAVAQILNRQAGPLSTAVLLEELTALGLVITGKNPKRNLSSAMSRNKLFKNIPGLGWWFTDRPIEDKGHHTSDSLPKTQPKMLMENSIDRAMRVLEKQQK